MPTYSYVCDACSHEFERFHAVTDEPIQLCPSCGRKRVRRRIGAGAGLIFKGSGFYLTDYARPKGITSDKPPPGPDRSVGAAGDDQGKAENSEHIQKDLSGKSESSSACQKSDQ